MSNSTALSALAAEFRRMVEPLPVKAYYKSFHTQPQHDGSPHIEEVNGKFEFVVTERGTEFERIKDLSTNDVLYMLMESITMLMATQYELENRKEGIDGRSVWFPYQEKLMAEFNPKWADRLSAEHAKALKEHPLRS